MFLLFLISCEVFGVPLAQDQNCGRREGAVANIVGGDKASKNEWPWLVAFVKIPEGNFFCAGSLLSSYSVLSGECEDEIICE